MDPARLNAADHDAMWTNLGDWTATTDYAQAATALATRVGDAARLGPADVVVDYACGFGDSLRLWITRYGVRRVVGVEPDPDVCATVQARVARWGLADRIRVVQARAESLPPRRADAEVSAVVCVDAAYHFETRAAWWRQLATDLPAQARIAVADLLLTDSRHPGLMARGIAAGVGIPAANLVDLQTLLQSLDALGVRNASYVRLGSAVLDGFAAQAPAGAWAIRLTAAAIRSLRRRAFIEYVVIAGAAPGP